MASSDHIAGNVWFCYQLTLAFLRDLNLWWQQHDCNPKHWIPNPPEPVLTFPNFPQKETLMEFICVNRNQPQHKNHRPNTVGRSQSHHQTCCSVWRMETGPSGVLFYQASYNEGKPLVDRVIPVLPRDDWLDWDLGSLEAVYWSVPENFCLGGQRWAGLQNCLGGWWMAIAPFH